MASIPTSKLEFDVQREMWRASVVWYSDHYCTGTWTLALWSQWFPGAEHYFN